MRAWGFFFVVILLSALLFVPMFARVNTVAHAPATNTPRAVAWVNHSIQKAEMVATVIPGLTTRTAFERDVRRHVDTFVPRVVIIGADSWISPREDHSHIDVQRRWHTPTIVRRVR